MHVCVSQSSLFKCIITYWLYKQIEPFYGTGVPKLTPGIGSAKVLAFKFANLSNSNNILKSKLTCTHQDLF